MTRGDSGLVRVVLPLELACEAALWVVEVELVDFVDSAEVVRDNGG